jgi:hypothetical protein
LRRHMVDRHRMDEVRILSRPQNPIRATNVNAGD